MLGTSLRIKKKRKYPQWGQTLLPPELLDNLAKLAYKTSKNSNELIQRDRQS